MDFYIFAAVAWAFGIPFVLYTIYKFNGTDGLNELSWPFMIVVTLLWPLFLIGFIIFLAIEWIRS